MAQLLLSPHKPVFRIPHRSLPSLPITLSSLRTSLPQKQSTEWNSLQLKLKCNGRYSCFFSDNRKEEAKRALESALGGKKDEFEKWNQQIQRREELGGGGASGGGGWFGWRRWFGGFDGEHFWQEAQTASLVILGLAFLVLVLAKGEVMLAWTFNPLLFALRGTRNLLTHLTSFVARTVSQGSPSAVPVYNSKEVGLSAKESVIRKWGSD